MVKVSVNRLPDVLEVEVLDDGCSGGHSDASSGHGLVGMRERVAVYGGELVTCPTDGGFRVWARIPARSAAADEAEVSDWSDASTPSGASP
jgi:signal transduction histidine kinase